jgi:DNA-binding NarL/FixJ family response regulator
VTTRVVIAHRSTVIRDVVRLLGASRAVVVVGETSRPAALAGLCRSERPDVTIAEATFEDGTEIESLLADLQATDTRTLVVGGDPSPERLTRALLLGASGYLHDDASLEQVVEAIGAVADGGSVLGPTAAATILEQWRRLREHKGAPEASAGALTARELDVLATMAEGLGAKAIARRLGVAVKTVESHKFRIFEKLGVHSQAHAVALAITHGLLTAPVPPPAAPVPGTAALVGSRQP